MTTTTTTPENSDALSAALRAHGEEASSMALRLVCDMLADMPEEIACAYADRVRELADARACEVADLLDAYRSAMDEEERAWAAAAALPPEDERCNDESGCDARATRILLRVNESTDLIYCDEHAPNGTLPLHTKERTDAPR